MIDVGGFKKLQAGLPLVVLLAGGSFFLAKVCTCVTHVYPCMYIPKELKMYLSHSPLFSTSQKFEQGRVEAKDNRVSSQSEREFSIEEEHKVSKKVRESIISHE